MTALGPMRLRTQVEQIMGMPISIHVRAEEPDRPEIDGAIANAYAHLRKVDSVLSPWRSDSDLIRVRRGALAWADAHPWLSEVRALCDVAAERTGGLFTSTLRGPDGSSGFDPTGLTKGWAVDGAARYLETVVGIGFSINAGGDVLCGVGAQMAGYEPLWRIGIEDPRQRGAILDIIAVTVGGVATSGNAARGPHILDPRTGQVVLGDGSVTVSSPTLMWADIWATAAFIDPHLRLPADADAEITLRA